MSVWIAMWIGNASMLICQFQNALKWGEKDEREYLSMTKKNAELNESLARCKNKYKNVQDFIEMTRATTE